MSFIKKHLFNFVSVTAAFILLMTFCLTGGRLQLLRDGIKGITPSWLALAALCMAIYFLLEGAVLFTLTRRLEPRYTYRHAFVAGMIGLLYNTLTPFSTGGQPAQLYHMSKNGVEAGSAGSIIAVKSIHYQFVLILSSLCSVIAGFGFFLANVSGYVTILVLGLLVNAAVAAAMLVCSLSLTVTAKLLDLTRRLLNKLRFIKRPDAVVDNLSNALTTFHTGIRAFGYKGWRTQARAFGIVCVQQAVYYAIPYLIYRSFGFDAQNALLMMAAIAFVNVISMYMPMPGASGAAEGSFYLFFSLFFTGGTVLPALLIWRLTTYYGQMLCGALTVAVSGMLAKRRG